MFEYTHSPNNQSQIHPKPDLRYISSPKYWEILSDFVIPIAGKNKIKILKIIKIMTDQPTSHLDQV
jgi:hypothetical protein